MSSATTTQDASKPSSHKLRRVFLVLALVGAVISAAARWWLPGWLQPQIEQAAGSALGTPVSFTKLSIHPWRLGVDVEGLRVGEANAPLLSLARAEVQLSLESIWHLTPVVRRITLSAPRIEIQRLSDQRFNFTPIFEHLQARPAAPAGPPTRFALFNISIHQGQVHYVDRVLHQEHVVDHIEVGVPFVSNLPSDISVDVRPALSARVDGSVLQATATSLPFTQDKRSGLDLHWHDVDLAKVNENLSPLLPPAFRLAVNRGSLDADLNLSFDERASPAPPYLAIQGKVDVRQLDARWPAQGLAWQWSSLAASGMAVQPLAHEITIADLTLTGAQVQAPLGTADHEGPVQAARPSKPSAPAAQADAPWRWSVRHIDLNVAAVQLTTAKHQPAPRLGPARLVLTGLSSAAHAAPAQLNFQAADAQGASVSVKGTAKPDEATVKLGIEVKKFQPSAWLDALGLNAQLPLALSAGDVGLQAQVEGDPRQINISLAQLRLDQIKTNAPKNTQGDHVDMVGLSLQGAQALLCLAPSNPTPSCQSVHGPGLQSFKATTLVIDQLDVQASRNAQGGWLGMAASPAHAAHARKVVSQRAAPLPMLAIDEISCKQCAVQVRDASVQPAARFVLTKADLTLHGASSDLGHPVQVDFSTLAQGQGAIKLQAQVQAQPLLAHGKLNINGLDLRVAQSYLDPLVNISLVGAKLNTNGDFDVQMGRAGLHRSSYKGSAGLSALRVLDRVNKADLLRWNSLSSTGMRLDWLDGAIKADLGRISLNQFYGRIILNADGQLNLSHIMRSASDVEPQSLTTPQAAGTPASGPQGVAAKAASAVELAASGAGLPTKLVIKSSTAPPSAASAPAPSVPASGPAMDMGWQHVALSQGRVDFTDNFVKPNYSAHLTRINGTISAVSSRKSDPANVQVSAAMDDYAPVSITGQVQPFGGNLYTDITASAHGIELTRLSTYAARYAGYAVEKGTLSADVHYKIDHGALDAENKIFLDQLTFGEKVNSPDATKLPVLLAVSLLKDSRGQINVDLPISGSLSDPHFSIGGIIWRVILNLLTKAILSPFSLLSGGGAQDLGFVPFAPGSVQLDDPAKQRLDSLITKLKDRPALKLEATGRADPVADENGLREAYVDHLMRVAKAKATDQSALDVHIDPAEKDQWLTAAYKTANIKKPRNMIGLAKTLPPKDMYDLLKAAAPVNNDALMKLANERGDAVKAYLLRQLPPERVLLTASKIGPPAEGKSAGPQVQFDLH